MELDGPQTPTEASLASEATAGAEGATSVIPVPAPLDFSRKPVDEARNVGSAAKPEPAVIEELSDICLRRLTRIKEGDNVLLRLPSDAIKAVVASRDGLISLGKFGAFPARYLLNLPYDITYEIIANPNTNPNPISEDQAPTTSTTQPSAYPAHQNGFGERKGKKQARNKGKETLAVDDFEDEDEDDEEVDGIGRGNNKGKGKGRAKGKGKGKDKAQNGGSGGGGKPGEKTNPGWANILRPLKRQAIVEAVVDDIRETNEFIDDVAAREDLMTQDEIAELRAQGCTPQEIIDKQIAKHQAFDLKTDFSKEKWRKRKEKKFYQTIHPIAPSAFNITSHFLARSPYSTMHLRNDTLSQLLNLGNVRPGGRYLVVDDTSGLVTAAMIERMGGEGRIMTFVESDSPPAWGVLGVMNFGVRELDCVRWLNWLEADEEYERPLPPDESDMPLMTAHRTAQRIKRHNTQVAELNANRTELFQGNWDAIVLATILDPISILNRLSPYLGGSGNVAIYSPHLQVLAQVLESTKKDPLYLFETLSESWTRTYQVLPGRTHPMMNTSATGGYLFSAIKINDAGFVPGSNKFARKKGKDLGQPGHAVRSEDSVAQLVLEEGGAEKRGLDDTLERLGKRKKLNEGVKGVEADEDEESAMNAPAESLPEERHVGVNNSGVTEMTFSTQSAVEEDELNL